MPVLSVRVVESGRTWRLNDIRLDSRAVPCSNYVRQSIFPHLGQELVLGIMSL